MFRLPVKIGLLCFSLIGIILGAHGVWVYFSRLELLFGAEGDKLFLAWDMPVRIQTAVTWMSVKGLQSWVIPAAFVAGGLVLFGISTSIQLDYRAPRWLRSLW